MQNDEVLASARALVHELVHGEVTARDFHDRVEGLAAAVDLGRVEESDLSDVLGRVVEGGWAKIEALGVDEMAIVMARCCGVSASASATATDDRDYPEDACWTWAWDVVYDCISDWCASPSSRAQGYDFTTRVVRACADDVSPWFILDMWLDGDDAETAWHFPDPEVQARVRNAITECGWYSGGTTLPSTPELNAAAAARTAARMAVEVVGGAGWAFNPSPSQEQIAAERAYEEAYVAYGRARERALGRDLDW